jgi:hypothetical protein
VKDETMKRYLIERDIPNIGNLSRAQLKDLAATSNNAVANFPGKCSGYPHRCRKDFLRLPCRKVKPWFVSTPAWPVFQ